jgi:hypothetical protein
MKTSSDEMLRPVRAGIVGLGTTRYDQKQLAALLQGNASFFLFTALFHYWTATLTVIVCWADPEAPLMVTLYVPGGVPAMP